MNSSASESDSLSTASQAYLEESCPESATEEEVSESEDVTVEPAPEEGAVAGPVPYGPAAPKRKRREISLLL